MSPRHTTGARQSDVAHGAEARRCHLGLAATVPISSSGDLFYVAITGYLPATPQLLDQGDPFDDGDYDGDMIVVDEANVYWISGGDSHSRASDDQGWALYKSCRVPK